MKHLKKLQTLLFNAITSSYYSLLLVFVFSFFLHQLSSEEETCVEYGMRGSTDNWPYHTHTHKTGRLFYFLLLCMPLLDFTTTTKTPHDDSLNYLRFFFRKKREQKMSKKVGNLFLPVIHCHYLLCICFKRVTQGGRRRGEERGKYHNQERNFCAISEHKLIFSPFSCHRCRRVCVCELVFVIAH